MDSDVASKKSVDIWGSDGAVLAAVCRRIDRKSQGCILTKGWKEVILEKNRGAFFKITHFCDVRILDTCDIIYRFRTERKISSN